MNPTTDSTLTDPQRTIADLRRELAEARAERDEALARETATSEVLGVINSSPGDLTPVFDAILEKAMRLCMAAFGVLWAYEGDRYRATSVRGAPRAFVEFLRQPLQPHYHSGTWLERALRGEDLIIDYDMSGEEAYQSGDPMRRAIVDLGGARSHIAVALRKDGALLGAITIFHQEVRVFSDKQIALLQNFAAQAVIAMENARLITETREALEQQTATAEVLGVINASPGDLAPVFDAMLKKATRLCDAAFGVLWLYEGESTCAVATQGVPRSFAEVLTSGTPEIALGILRTSANVVHLVDAADTDAYRSGDPLRRAMVDLGGARTMLGVPLRKDAASLGVFVIYRREVRPFSEKQMALVQNFAAQTVIAIENVRLLTETRETLEQQTATAEVLGVINSSPGDLAPVFDTMLDKALRLCGAELGVLLTYDGSWHTASLRGAPSQYAEFMTGAPLQPGPATGLGRLVRERQVIHIRDIADDDAYRGGERDPLRVASLELAGMRTFLAIPLVKDDALLGALVVYRQEVRPFSDKQIALLKNFAAQAVIAMENARLITETREALDQQTATAEVLQVINSSPGDLAPVFDAILEKAHALCGATLGSLQTYDGEFFRAVASRGLPDTFEELLSEPFRPGPNRFEERLVRRDDLVHIPDVRPLGPLPDDPLSRTVAQTAGLRTLLLLPLRREAALVGYVASARSEVRPFTDKQIALLQNFAAQAVIAMENARLITETREALDQQTATAEVLEVINSSPGDLAPVFKTMLERGIQLCAARFGLLGLYDGDRFRGVAAVGFPPEAAEALSRLRHPPPGTTLYHVQTTHQLAQVTDISTEAAFTPVLEANPSLRGARTNLAVPMLRGSNLIGAIIVFREVVRQFTVKEIALLENFAAQAVIAVENARLVTETREALERQTATADVLGVINSSLGDLTPVFDAMLEKAMRLCQVAFGQLATFNGEHFRTAATRGVPPAFAEYRKNNPPLTDRVRPPPASCKASASSASRTSRLRRHISPESRTVERLSISGARAAL